MAEAEASQWKSEILAAEAYAQDTSEWIIFDASIRDLEELDTFLDNNKPSVIKSSDGIGWINVRSPKHSELGEDLDLDGLLDAWESADDSGTPITYDTVFELSKKHRCLIGKWLFHKESGIKVDLAWACIARAVVSGQCGMSAKVSPKKEENGTNMGRHVICVYNSDFTDSKAVIDLDDCIRRAGIKCSMTYKPDAFTYMGIYRNNKWSLRPTIYSSQYDVMLKKSKIIATYKSPSGR